MQLRRRIDYHRLAAECADLAEAADRQGNPEMARVAWSAAARHEHQTLCDLLAEYPERIRTIGFVAVNEAAYWWRAGRRELAVQRVHEIIETCPNLWPWAVGQLLGFMNETLAEAGNN